MMKLFVYFKSMKFGITLLILIMMISMIGTVIPQGLDEHYYSTNYEPLISNILLMVGLDDLYNSVLFGILFIMLIINLTTCSIARLGRIVKCSQPNFSANNMELIGVENVDSKLTLQSAVEGNFKRYGFNTYLQDKTNENNYCSIKNKAGYFGSWFLHFGILLVIVCYTYGNITYFSEGVYGVPGTVQALEGTEYQVKINNFNITYGEDNSVQQYTTNIAIIDSSGKTLKASNAAVNEPLRFEGYNFYQTGYGWAAKFNILKDGESIILKTVYEKTSVQIPEEGIGIYFNRFYPEFTATNNGVTTQSDQLNNPVILLSVLYMGEVVKMDFIPINETIKWNDYEFAFHNPQRYTYLEVNKMNGQLGALVGALLIVFGIVLVFYLKPVRMAICFEEGRLYIYKGPIINKQNKQNDNNYKKEKNIYAR